MTTAQTTRPGFNEPLRTDWILPGHKGYSPSRPIIVVNDSLAYTDRDGREWPISNLFGFDGPSTPELARSIGPDWRKCGPQSALHDQLIRNSHRIQQLSDVASEWFGTNHTVYQWRVADHLWFESLFFSAIHEDKRSAYWLAVRLGSIHRTRKHNFGFRRWWSEIRWTWREAFGTNRARLIGSFVWGLVSFRWLREALARSG